MRVTTLRRGLALAMLGAVVAVPTVGASAGSQAAQAPMPAAWEQQRAAEAAAAQASAEQVRRNAQERRAAQKRAQERKAARQRAARARAAAGGTPAANRQLGMQMCADRGWSASQCADLAKLWQKESGWSTSAHNASSGAHGIPQALPGSKMASKGSDWATSARTQIAWGLDYIARSYGNPSNAWAHSVRTGWY